MRVGGRERVEEKRGEEGRREKRNSRVGGEKREKELQSLVLNCLNVWGEWSGS